MDEELIRSILGHAVRLPDDVLSNMTQRYPFLEGLKKPVDDFTWKLANSITGNNFPGEGSVDQALLAIREELKRNPVVRNKLDPFGSYSTAR